MFRNIAEDVVLFLLRKKKLNADNREIYAYAFEVILLNASLLMTLFAISLVFEQVIYFWCYVVFFIPLRVFSGGYHSSDSETCFIWSNVVYTVTLLISKYTLSIYDSKLLVGCTLVVMVITMLLSPIENKNHPLTKTRKDRNKKYVIFIVIVDLALLLYLISNEMTIASREMILVLLNGILMLLGMIKNRICQSKLQH